MRKKTTKNKQQHEITEILKGTKLPWAAKLGFTDIGKKQILGGSDMENIFCFQDLTMDFIKFPQYFVTG